MQRISLFVLSALSLLNFSGVNCAATVPSDLSSAFDPSSIALQVSFNDQSDNGIKDGSTISQKDAGNTPTFALGDASGVNTEIKFVIMMIDTTSSQRVLHYLQTDFQATEEKTAIASQTKPLQAYKAPGTLGDSGPRDYTFLMYEQKKAFQASAMPSPGSNFDVKTFSSSNGLGDALAGIALSVQVSGGSNFVSSASQPQTSQQVASQSVVSQNNPSNTVQIAQTTAQQTTAQQSAAQPTTAAVAPGTPTTTIVASSCSLSQATSAIASMATVNPGGLVSGLSTAAASVASAAASGASGVVASGSAAGSVATSTSSAPAVQVSNGAVQQRSKAFASLPILVFVGVLLA